MFYDHFEIFYPHRKGKFYIPEHADAIVDITLHNPPKDLDRYIIDAGYARMIVGVKSNWCLPHAIFRYADPELDPDNEHVRLSNTSSYASFRPYTPLHIWQMPCDITVKYAYISGFDGLVISYAHPAPLVADSQCRTYLWKLGFLTYGGNPAVELYLQTSGSRVMCCWMDQGRVTCVDHYQIFGGNPQKI